jgi:pyrroline-5-carboxylate reductase
MPKVSPTNPLLFFGCGNMGRAMLDGWLKGGADPASFIVIDPAAGTYPKGVRHFADAALLSEKVSQAIVAVKPQMFANVAATLNGLLTYSATIISVMAGMRSAAISGALPGRTVVRLMPNLAASLGKSPLGLFAESANAPLRADIETLLAPLGTPIWIDDEVLMDAVTALAGSGPAFVYRFIDALTKAGEALGLNPEVSARLAMAMIEGSVELAATSDADPEELARRVTSPGGTTAAGLSVLDQDSALAELIAATLKAARDRGVELSKPE